MVIKQYIHVHVSQNLQSWWDYKASRVKLKDLKKQYDNCECEQGCESFRQQTRQNWRYQGDGRSSLLSTSSFNTTFRTWNCLVQDPFKINLPVHLFFILFQLLLISCTSIILILMSILFFSMDSYIFPLVGKNMLLLELPLFYKNLLLWTLQLTPTSLLFYCWLSW